MRSVFTNWQTQDAVNWDWTEQQSTLIEHDIAYKHIIYGLRDNRMCTIMARKQDE